MSEPGGGEPSGGRTLTIAGSTDHLSVSQFRLVDPANPGRPFISSGARVVIGSHESADLKIEDPAVSRFHCEISISQGRALVRDLDSRNGTWVDGTQINSAF